MQQDNDDQCPICFNITIVKKLFGSNHNVFYYYINCPRCGEFQITTTAAKHPKTRETLGEPHSPIRSMMSSWIRQRKPTKMLSFDFFNDPQKDELGSEFWSIKSPTVNEKAEKLLVRLAIQSKYAGQKIDWDNDSLGFEADSWALNYSELEYLFDYLKKLQLIDGGVVDSRVISNEDDYKPVAARLLPTGWAKFEEIEAKKSKSSQAFVAMWFHESVTHLYTNALAGSISDAGYAPFKINDKEHSNKIDDEIVVEIKKSRFVVADFTGHRGGVYFEAGFAMGLGLPVIWTCRNSDLNKLHFDIRQYNCLTWENDSLDDFKNKLKNRILAVVGPGPNYREE